MRFFILPQIKHLFTFSENRIKW